MAVALDKYDNVNQESIELAANNLKNSLPDYKNKLEESIGNPRGYWTEAEGAVKKVEDAYNRIIGEEFYGNLEKELENIIAVCNKINSFKEIANRIKGNENGLNENRSMLETENNNLNQAKEENNTVLQEIINVAIHKLIDAIEKICQQIGDDRSALERIDQDIQSMIN